MAFDPYFDHFGNYFLKEKIERSYVVYNVLWINQIQKYYVLLSTILAFNLWAEVHLVCSNAQRFSPDIEIFVLKQTTHAVHSKKIHLSKGVTVHWQISSCLKGIRLLSIIYVCKAIFKNRLREEKKKQEEEEERKRLMESQEVQLSLDSSQILEGLTPCHFY